MKANSVIHPKMLGISRSHRFSPNSTGRDEAIFMAVANRLQRLGGDVSIISEDLFVGVDLSEFSLVFSMARGRDVLKELAEAEKQCELIVVNSATKLLNSTRAELCRMFREAHVPQPNTVVCNPLQDDCPSIIAEHHLQMPLWLKRGDACAQSATDVRQIKSADELEQAIREYVQNGISSLCIEEHLEGDLIKFYGVQGSGFFVLSYPTENQGFSKFGLEHHNSEVHHYAFDQQALHRIAEKASAASGFTIYGGDAIIRCDGSFALIDFNDWPSFSSCRKEAAKAIAQRIYQELENCQTQAK